MRGRGDSQFNQPLCLSVSKYTCAPGNSFKHQRPTHVFIKYECVCYLITTRRRRRRRQTIHLSRGNNLFASQLQGKRCWISSPLLSLSYRIALLNIPQEEHYYFVIIFLMINRWQQITNYKGHILGWTEGKKSLSIDSGILGAYVDIYRRLLVRKNPGGYFINFWPHRLSRSVHKAKNQWSLNTQKTKFYYESHI